jgi:hypothetical protein
MQVRKSVATHLESELQTDHPPTVNLVHHVALSYDRVSHVMAIYVELVDDL